MDKNYSEPENKYRIPIFLPPPRYRICVQPDNKLTDENVRIGSKKWTMNRIKISDYTVTVEPLFPLVLSDPDHPLGDDPIDLPVVLGSDDCRNEFEIVIDPPGIVVILEDHVLPLGNGLLEQPSEVLAERALFHLVECELHDLLDVDWIYKGRDEWDGGGALKSRRRSFRFFLIT